MNKKIYLISIILSLFLSISSTNAWRDCDNAGTCTECNPDILTHCEPLNSNTNTCVNPDTPGCASTTTPNPYSGSNTSTSTQNTDTSNKKTAYLYIKYKDTAGRIIYSIPSYKGKGGEIVDLTKYKKDLASYKFIKYNPNSAKITLKGGAGVNAYLIYEKVYSSSNVNNTSQDKKDAYLYIKYRDTAGRNIYTIPTYKGKDGEVINLSKYKKDLSFFKFVKYTPENGQITLKGGKSLSVYIIYEKENSSIKNNNKNSYYYKNLPSKTKKVDKIDNSNSYYYKNLNKTKTDTKKIDTSSNNTKENIKKTDNSNNLTTREKQVEKIKSNVNNYFKKKKITGKKKDLLLKKLTLAIKKVIKKEKNQKKKDLYSILLEVIKGLQSK